MIPSAKTIAGRELASSDGLGAVDCDDVDSNQAPRVGGQEEDRLGNILGPGAASKRGVVEHSSMRSRVAAVPGFHEGRHQTEHGGRRCRCCAVRTRHRPRVKPTTSCLAALRLALFYYVRILLNERASIAGLVHSRYFDPGDNVKYATIYRPD